MMARLPRQSVFAPILFGRLFAALLTLLFVFSLSAPAHGASDAATEAERLYQEGLHDYKAQRYAAAIASLSRSFELNPQAQTLFAWAQSERLLFHCENATALFDRFIAMAPTERQVAAAQLAKRRCTQAPTDTNLVKPAAVPVATQSMTAGAWYQDVAGGALCAVGVVGVASGLGLLVSAHGLAASADSADNLGASQSERRAAEQRWAWGAGTMVAGALLFAGGVSRYVSVSRSSGGAVFAVGAKF